MPKTSKRGLFRLTGLSEDEPYLKFEVEMYVKPLLVRATGASKKKTPGANRGFSKSIGSRPVNLR